MWTCPKCARVFEKINQVHTCNKVPLEFHFKNKDHARELFENLVKKIKNKIGECKIISIPCCVHLYGTYDFLAALPKKDRLEVRFSLSRILKSPRLRISVPVSHKHFKNCIDIKSKDEIDTELLAWIREAYHLKDT
jgi:hypothetical protein